jgi:hypothetical protein
MAQASVEVPAALVGAVRETVVLLYGSSAEALHHALRSHAEHRERRDEVARCRARLADLDELLARLGWWDDPGGAPCDLAGALACDLAGALPCDVALSAPRDVLHDVLYGALIDAGERLARACGEGWGDGAGRRDGVGAGTVRATAMEVIALDGLLAEVRDEARR